MRSFHFLIKIADIQKIVAIEIFILFGNGKLSIYAGIRRQLRQIRRCLTQNVAINGKTVYAETGFRHFAHKQLFVTEVVQNFRHLGGRRPGIKLFFGKTEPQSVCGFFKQTVLLPFFQINRYPHHLNHSCSGFIPNTIPSFAKHGNCKNWHKYCIYSV